MADINMVNVEPNVVDNRDQKPANHRAIQCDLNDFQQLTPLLKQVQKNSSKTLKDYHDYLNAQTQKKNIGVPYNMIKKFDQIKLSILQASKIIEKQCLRYKSKVSNREYDKSYDQHFFRKTMRNYNDKRLWMKQYLKRNQNKMQKVEQQVNKNLNYETHQYTQFYKNLNIERIEHNYDIKMDQTDCIVELQYKNNMLRSIIMQKLKKACENHKKDLKTQQEIGKLNQIEMKFPNMNNSFQSCVTPFTMNSLTKAYIKRQYFLRILNDIVKNKKQLLVVNQNLKISIDLIKQQVQDRLRQNTLIEQQYRQFYQSEQGKLILTKTDYFIFMKELYREVQKIITKYGVYQEYSIREKVCFLNRPKSYSYKTLAPIKQLSKSAYQQAEFKQLTKHQQIKKQSIKNIFQQEK